MTARTIMTLFSLLILSGGNTVFARDVVTITSDKTAVVDKVNGTAVWLKNVRIVRESSGSNLVSDRFSAKRDPISGRIIQGEAIGNVRAVYFPPTTDPAEPDLSEKGDGIAFPTTITCSQITYDHNTALVILSGNVKVYSSKYELQAERVRYHYRNKRGRISALPREQVQFVFYKKPSPNQLKADTENPERQKITGVADEILVDRVGRKAVLQGKVVVDDHSDQSRFKADRAELFFDEVEEIKTIIADGNFSMNQPKRISRANRAVFEYQTDEVTLIGNAYVKEENNMEISSARIKMYMKVDRGIISGVDDVPVKMKIELE